MSGEKLPGGMMKVHWVVLGLATLFTSGALATEVPSSTLNQPRSYVCLVSAPAVAERSDTRSAVATGNAVETMHHFPAPYDDTPDPTQTCAAVAGSSRFELVKAASKEGKESRRPIRSTFLMLTPPN